VAFVSGYVLIWTTFSALAAAGQILLHRAALLDRHMRLTSAVVSGVLLIGTGLYQWLPLKNSCLSQCHSPFGFLTQRWREGMQGALVMGVRHGTFCVGCCWLLMMLLFVLGVMNLVWIAALAAFVLIEKLVRSGAILSRLAGIAAAAWGIYLLVAG
jgi:predicted metal-binding membrane protein